ncbi:hypothetical protein GCM10022393_12590 [Aquimarina addita]|uniref:F5/8 type C domain-containing protein n=1 Tax=Aquimarina addita TaxID=870485 RepID=A0ABP7XED1_9FLAO
MKNFYTSLNRGDHTKIDPLLTKSKKNGIINPLKKLIQFSILGCILLTITPIVAAEYTVSSAEEFNNLNLVAGDVVTWTDGIYTDQTINFINATGTSTNPIILKAQTPGGVIFTGTSKLFFFGSYLIVDGFYWKEGNGTSDHIQFRRNGSNTDFGTNCIIRNCAFNNLFTIEPEKSRWIVLHGTNNVVENCSFINKLSAGAVILVELAYQGSTIAGHIIQNNYFYNITPKDAFSTNSGDCEAIRIGVSEFQSLNASVLVENNYFQAADGENEIITNKSANNIFKRNTFRNCRGSLVLRHGAGALVEGNFFLGEGKAKSGGIRVTDRDHVIINNYMQGLSNDGDIWNNGITLVGGGESSGGSGNGYQNVDNVLIAFNTIYNSDDPFHYNDRNSYDPTGTIAYNLVYSVNSTDIVTGDISGTGQGMTYVGNIFGGTTVGITDPGITEADAEFSANGEIFTPSATGAAADAAGNTYSSTVDFDIEGLIRPDTNMDVGAHEVSGGTGSIFYAPITDSQIGNDIGCPFLDTDDINGSSDNISLSGISSFAAIGGTLTTNVTANIAWSASIDNNPTWVSLSNTSGTNNGTIDITTIENTDTTSRTATLTVTGGDITRTLTITQEAADPTAGLNLINTGTNGNPVSVFTNTEQTGNEAVNTLDKNFDTRWSGFGLEAEVIYDLGNTYFLDIINIATLENKTYLYEILVSTDGNTFTSISDVSSNTTGDFESYPVNAAASHIKIIGGGQPGGTDWNSITEIEFYGELNNQLSVEEYNAVSQSGITTYPNPVNNQLTILRQNLSFNEINFFSIDGKRIFSKTLNKTDLESKINVSSLAKGLYLMNISNGSQRIMKRVIISR